MNYKYFMMIISFFLVLQTSITFAEKLNATITDFRGRGGRLDWSSNGKFVVFDRKGWDGGYDLYLTYNFKDEQCLTCKHPALPNQKRKYGQPVIHPDNRYVVFQAEKQKHPMAFPLITNPGGGVYNDIWIYDLQTNRAQVLWEVPNKKSSGVLHPQFSKDGKRLSWSQLYKAGDIKDSAKAAGAWKLMVADFSPSGLTNVKSYQPGDEVIYENHGFSHDGKWLYFSSNLKETVPVNEGTNIYKINLKTEELVQLTHEGYNEHAHISPDGEYIVWMSSVGNGNSYDYYKVGSDYWIMKTDGSNKQRLTHLNDPTHPHFRGRYAVVADFAWDPFSSRKNGYRFYAYLHTLVVKNFGIPNKDKKSKGEYNFMVTFAPEKITDPSTSGNTGESGHTAGGTDSGPGITGQSGGVTTEVVSTGSVNASSFTSYLGYYAEDPRNNPEDPVGGFISARLPEKGNFNAEFLFSYMGCSGGIDSGKVRGKRTAQKISGSWSGTTDNVEVSGKMSASLANNTFSGTYTVNGGKKQIGPFAFGCSYFVAGHGIFKIAAIGNDITTKGSSMSDLQFTCKSIKGANGYAWMVADSECLLTTGSISACSHWNGLGESKKILMRQGNTIKPLVPGKEYTVGCIGYSGVRIPRDLATGTFVYGIN